MLNRPFIFITFKKFSITFKKHHVMNHMEISYLQVAEMLFFKLLLHFFQIFLEKKLVTIQVCCTALLYCFIPANHCWNLLLMERTVSRCWWGWSVICGSWCKQITYYFGLFLCQLYSFQYVPFQKYTSSINAWQVKDSYTICNYSWCC